VLWVSLIAFLVTLVLFASIVFSFKASFEFIRDNLYSLICAFRNVAQPDSLQLLTSALFFFAFVSGALIEQYTHVIEGTNNILNLIINIYIYIYM
jgi:hypothetical protein